jgi:hypothetical protein
MLAQAQKQRAAMDTGLPLGVAAAAQSEHIVWPTAVRYAALAGLLAAALTLVALALPPVILLAWFWAVGAPVVVLGVYNAKLRPPRLGPGFGARLGLLCGLAIALCMAVVNVGDLVISRFVLHDRQFDSQLAAMFAQMRVALQQSGNAAAQTPVLTWLTIPEDRVGLLLLMSGIALLLYLLLSTLGGAFAALLRSRSEAR